MLRFRFFDAGHGDAFLVQWGDEPRTMLVDGGPRGLYNASLRGRLLELGTRVLDVVCLSHVDDDHAAGIDRLLAELSRACRDQEPAPFAVERFWFNSVEELLDGRVPGLAASLAPVLTDSSTAVAASFTQGRAIRANARALGLSDNRPFGGAVLAGKETEVDGLAVRVLGPDEAALTRLTDTWRAARRRGDLEPVAASYSDPSVPNLSSIVLQVGHGGRTALLTGDARGDHILSSLVDLGLLPEGGRYVTDLLKLPHHGSWRSVEADFFERVHAHHYVISADGRHHHPQEETLQALVGSRDRGDSYVIHLTHPISFAEELLAELAHSRAFEVRVRPDDDDLVIDLG